MNNIKDREMNYPVNIVIISLEPSDHILLQIIDMGHDFTTKEFRQE